MFSLYCLISFYLYYRKSIDYQKDMKSVLNMYKRIYKDQREKVKLMAAEKILTSQLDELEEAKQAFIILQV